MTMQADGLGAGVELGTRRVLKPGPLRWLRALGWMVLLTAVLMIVPGMLQGVVMVLGAIAGGADMAQLQADPADVLTNAPGWSVLLGAVIMVGASIALYVGMVRGGEDRRPSELALAPAVKELVVGLLIGLAMMAVVVAVLWAAGWVQLAQQPVTKIAGALAYTLQSGVTEEIVFRGVILRLLWRAFGPWAALAISAAMFGAVHYTNPNASAFAAACIAIEAGVMLGAFYILTGRLWVPIGVHAAWNFAQGWLFGAPVSGTDLFSGGPLAMTVDAGTPAWLSGGAFGPEASLPGLAMGIGIGLVVLVMAWKRGRFTSADATLGRADDGTFD